MDCRRVHIASLLSCAGPTSIGQFAPYSRKFYERPLPVEAIRTPALAILASISATIMARPDTCVCHGANRVAHSARDHYPTRTTSRPFALILISDHEWPDDFHCLDLGILQTSPRQHPPRLPAEVHRRSLRRHPVARLEQTRRNVSWLINPVSAYCFWDDCGKVSPGCWEGSL